ncbi:uncharacterized protein E0L32_002483 [Thyridium curvatum]|uniref:ASST-domain-containing protein n=1 Tax=Thyridium curvatum TaxID=1093900 RepID=A0A507BGY8_9PEZI|nr:uncharacterized protein E0L32_002483 [Thyridium curvatum]TPX18626.1 hypothetical protein E0L32_002483 [Thyridium curvatum]
MPSLTTVAIWAGTFGLASGDWQFRSRPDLAPPRLNITIPATDEVAPGYIFVAPYSGIQGPGARPEQPAGYIFTNTGDLVWSSLGHLAGWVNNLRPVTYEGRPGLQAFHGSVDPIHGHGYGIPVILDQSYRQIAAVQSRSEKLLSIHEFRIVGQKTALVEVYQPTPMDLTPYGGSRGEMWIADEIFQEIDIATGEVIFEGHSLDFASPAESVISLRSGVASTGQNSSDAWDYFHLNSIDKDDEGNYLVSGCHTSTIYKIDGQSGDVIWRLGGRMSNFSLTGGWTFGFQHDARFLGRSTDETLETISFFDNSARSNASKPDGIEHLNPSSSGRIVLLNHEDGTAKVVQTFIPPDNLSVSSQGNTQALDNGNVFISWGQRGAVTEFKADGTPIFHANLDSGLAAVSVWNYRGFRHEWTGEPFQKPSIVALRGRSNTTVYVSWNGDTKTKMWRFFACFGSRSKNKSTSVKLAGESTRSSFETSFTLPDWLDKYRGLGIGFFAEAVDANGTVLTTTDEITVQVDVNQEME